MLKISTCPMTHDQKCMSQIYGGVLANHHHNYNMNMKIKQERPRSC